MTSKIEVKLSIEKILLDNVKNLVEQLDLSQNELIELALRDFVAAQIQDERIINQGDVYWIKSDHLTGLKSDISHPQVVIQDNLLNHSRIQTVVVCALTSNLKRVNMPGNVLLEVDEANLPRQSVVEIAKVSSIHKSQLGEYVGSLSEKRVQQILSGMKFVQKSFLR